jgi:hypothetical protein
MRYEALKTDDELMFIDFDQYGHPFSMKNENERDDYFDDDEDVNHYGERLNDVENCIADCKDEVKIALSDHLETLMKTDPEFCRKIGIIPKPIIVK